MIRITLSRLAAAAAMVAASSAYADIVVIVNPAAGTLTAEQVSDIYLGRNATFTPTDQPEGSAVRNDFYKKATGRDPAQVKAVWSRLVFSGKGQPPKEYADAAAVKKAVAADPKAVGYIDKSAVDGTVKAALTLN
jgi:ABC-type phosphate transport system substrate-binding protein